jgi:hypothetical protein
MKSASRLGQGPQQATPKNYLQVDPTHNLYEVGATGDRTLVQQGVPKTKDVTWGAPVSEVRGGKPARVQYDSQGNSRVVDGAVPYEKPDQGPRDNPYRDRQQVAGLRKEFDGLPEVKNYNLVIPTYQRAVNAPNTRAGDLSLVYALGKIFDPGSVVREGELILSKDAAPWLAKIVASTNSQINGAGAINAETRKEIIAAMQGQVESLRSQYDMRREQFSSYASDYGAEPFSVVGRHPGGDAPAGSPGTTNILKHPSGATVEILAP